jgi:hypothetical protein
VHKQHLRLAALVVALLSPATAQVAILQIHVIEGEGAVHPPGSRVSRPLVVEVTDETGKPVPAAAVSFHLPDVGPTGVFLNGLRTEVSMTDAAGRAVLHGVTLNRTPGRFQIRVVASKEQARAGVISFQYIAEPHSGAAAAAPVQTPLAPQPAASHSGHGRWLIVAAAVGGGAVAGILGAGRKSGSTSTPPAATPQAPTLTIGAPSSTVVKP